MDGRDLTPEESANVKARVQDQFGAASAAYVVSDVHAKGESLGVLLDAIPTEPGWHALDVATGAGHTALAFAPRVNQMIAFDLTPEMLGTAAKLARERALPHFETRLGDAESLPFADESFDLVTCRLAFHHFPNQEDAFREMARVLRVGGWFGFTDNFVVEDPDGAKFYNDYERLRDPSHHEVLPLSALTALAEAQGLALRSTHRLTKEFEFQDWADRQRVSADDKDKLLAMLRAVPTAVQPLLAPRFADGTAYFSLWEVVLTAQKVR
jgi:SAM-dependent methyltransferase